MYSREKGYDLFEDEDDDSLSDANGTSSDDEIDIILHGTPEQRKKLKQSYRKKHQGQQQSKKSNLTSKSSSEDEFEKEMNSELNKQVQVLESNRDRGIIRAITSTSAADTGVSTLQVSKNTASQFYDGAYFDSDEEDDAEINKHTVVSNDDLLYDPDMDDEDQKWVDKQRNHGLSRDSNSKGIKAPNSDALLDCPACMTTLCLDCQRHEVYRNQYRAMFVMNCTPDPSESLECPEQATKKRKKKKGSQSSNSQTSGNSLSSDVFHPVKCNECKTVVGVIDSEEVYHFFNVLASYT
ncbi:E2F-associated phosphoprotein [Biomphalaria glabrata]|nr:E2F-associated phosphoprotein-like [Biomphalaria glabrata]